MRRLLLVVLVSLAGLGTGIGAARAQATVPAGELVARGADFDGATITVEGELIGDYGFRADGSLWVQLDDDSYARRPLAEGGPLAGPNVGIGVRLPASLGADLDPPGGYRRRGPLVQVTGIWRHHDSARGGESYLDADVLVVVEPGRTLPEGPHPWAIVVGLVSIVASVGLWRSYVRVRERL